MSAGLPESSTAVASSSTAIQQRPPLVASGPARASSVKPSVVRDRGSDGRRTPLRTAPTTSFPALASPVALTHNAGPNRSLSVRSQISEGNTTDMSSPSPSLSGAARMSRGWEETSTPSLGRSGSSASASTTPTSPEEEPAVPAVPMSYKGKQVERNQRGRVQGGAERPSHLEYDAPMTDALRWQAPAQPVEKSRRSAPPEAATFDGRETAQPSIPPSRPSFRSALSQGSKYLRPSSLFPTTPPRPGRSSRTTSSVASSSSSTFRERPQEEESALPDSSPSKGDVSAPPVTPPRPRSPFLLRRKSKSKSNLRSSDDLPPPLPEDAASRASSSLAAPLLALQPNEGTRHSRKHLTTDALTMSRVDREVPAPSQRSSSMMASWVSVDEETSGDQASIQGRASTTADITASSSGDTTESSRPSSRPKRPSFVNYRSKSVTNLLSFGSSAGDSEGPSARARGRDGLLLPPLMDSPDEFCSTIPLPTVETIEQPLEVNKQPASSRRSSSRWTDRLPRILGNKLSSHPSVVASHEAEQPEVCVPSSSSQTARIAPNAVADSASPLKSIDTENIRASSKSLSSGLPRQRKSSTTSSGSRQTPLSPEMAQLWLAADERGGDQQTRLQNPAEGKEEEQVMKAAAVDDELAEPATPSRRRSRANSLSRALSIMFDPRPPLEEAAPELPQDTQVASSSKVRASSSQRKSGETKRQVSNEQGRRASVSHKPSNLSSGSGGSKTIKAKSSAGSSTSTGSRSTPEKAGLPRVRKKSPTPLRSSSGASARSIDKPKARDAECVAKTPLDSATSVGLASGGTQSIEAIDPAATPKRRQTTVEHSSRRPNLGTLAGSSSPVGQDGTTLRQRRTQSLSITPQRERLPDKKGKRSSTASRLTGFQEEMSKAIVGPSGDAESSTMTSKPHLQMHDLSDQAFLEVLTAARRHHQEKTALQQEEEDKLQRLTELGMGPAARRATMDRPITAGLAGTRTSTGERRSTGAIKRSSSADGRLNDTKDSDVDISGPLAHSSSERALGVGEPLSPVIAFIGANAANSDEEWAREVKACFIIRELLDTEQSYARHLESLLVAVRKRATVGGVTRSAPPSGVSSFASTTRSKSITGASGGSQQSNSPTAAGGLDRSLPLLRSLLPQLLAVSRSLASRIDSNATPAGVGSAFSLLADQLETTFVAWSSAANEIMSGLRASQGSKSKAKERLVLTPTLDTDVSVFRTATAQQRRDSSGSQRRPSLTESNRQSRVASSSRSPSIHEEASVDESASVPPRSTNLSRSSSNWGIAAYNTTKSKVTAAMTSSSSSSSIISASSSSTTLAASTSRRRMSASPSAQDLPPIPDSPSSGPSGSKSNRLSVKPKTPAPTPQQQQRPKTLTALDVAIMPMQRVPRYLLLLAALESNVPDRSVNHARVVKSLETMRAIAKKCDEAARMR